MIHHYYLKTCFYYITWKSKDNQQGEAAKFTGLPTKKKEAYFISFFIFNFFLINKREKIFLNNF